MTSVSLMREISGSGLSEFRHVFDPLNYSEDFNLLSISPSCSRLLFSIPFLSSQLLFAEVIF